MRRSDRNISDEKIIDGVIERAKICRLGFDDDGEVYIVPLNYGYRREGEKRILYFHGASQGRKVNLIRHNPKVSFEMDTDFAVISSETACGYSAAYACVMGTGIIEELKDSGEKVAALQALMATMSGRDNWTFDEKSVNNVFVFKLTVDSLSCKVHSA